ncbi:actin, putative [Eimeria maxima]|uniref:Actin, putative n=1 Tax=Eimeria maxima TaxID=5804 RepID=U6LZH1_EIMMA|nr:actin, putative [Eimeria maxima]CDJ57141.1 actin, putative [Eimeria maxima]
METPTVIIDNGSGFIKAGTNTDSLPSVFFPTVVGFPRRRFLHLFNDKPSQEKIFIGDKAVENRHQLTIVNPIDHGHIDDWEQMAYVWQHVYDVLGLNPSEHPCLLTEPPNCSSTHRNKLAETLFEGFDAPEVCLGVTGLMAIYGTGQTTGLVVDIGEGVTQCVPVFDGYLEASSLRRSDFGGEELQMYLQKILCDMGYQMTTRDDYEHVRVIKETLCFCSLDPASDQQRTDLDRTYHLPDGLTLRDGETTYLNPKP